jgi:transcriptional regulator with XRE-family HTH domain
MHLLLKNWIKEKELTYTELGRKLKTSPSVVHAWANGKTIPSKKFAVRLAKATKYQIPISHWGYGILPNGKIVKINEENI